jgi:putative membrane protein
MTEQQTAHNAPALDVSTRLAFARTRAAYERTMMAWIRTATSLITFGFTIYKFFQIEAPPPGRPNRLIGPRGFAFILVSIGLFSLILATLEHRQDIRTLGAQYEGERRSLAVVVAALISILGILALVVILFRQ